MKTTLSAENNYHCLRCKQITEHLVYIITLILNDRITFSAIALLFTLPNSRTTNTVTNLIKMMVIVIVEMPLFSYCVRMLTQIRKWKWHL